MQIGYIGLGALGAELARCFLREPGHTLTVWDLHPAARARLAQAGAQVAASPAELARACDVVLLCLPRSDDVRQLVLGDGQLIAGLSPGKLVIDQTSGTPGETARIAAELADRGVSMIDAAVSANPQLVHQGTATLMVAGPAAVVERALPLLTVMTRTIRRCGDRVGDGQAVKLVNNAVYAATRLGTLELAALACKAGHSLQAVHAQWHGDPARSQATERMLPAMLRGEASTNFALALMLKDLNQAVAFGMANGTSMPIASLTRALLQSGLHLRGPQAQLEDMQGVVASLSGVEWNAGAQPAMATSAAAGELEALGLAVAAINFMATLECVSAGLRYGLALSALQEVLACSSGASAAGASVLAALSGNSLCGGVVLRDSVQAQRHTAGMAMRHGAPVFLSTLVAGLIESAAQRLEPAAAMTDLTRAALQAPTSAGAIDAA